MKANATPGTPGFPIAQKYYAASSNGLGKTQKALFNNMLNYRSVQNTGARDIDWNNGKHPEQLYDSLRELISNIRKTVQTMFNAHMAAQILSSPLNEKPIQLPPAALRLFTHEKTGSPEQKRGGRQL